MFSNESNTSKLNNFAMKSSRQEIFKTIAVSLQQSIIDESNGLNGK